MSPPDAASTPVTVPTGRGNMASVASSTPPGISAMPKKPVNADSAHTEPNDAEAPAFGMMSGKASAQPVAPMR